MSGSRRRGSDSGDDPVESAGGALPVARFATRGQPTALAAVERMITSGAPQALLLVGPPSTGKTTLALDLAAGLLCEADDRAMRPCRACRACRLVAHGTHQDLHRLAPEGAGRQVRIGDAVDPDPGTVRHLLHELARRPVEGEHRVAIVEGAHRMNEDAQNAILKTLEEPPAGVTIVLCADDAEHLLPTIRSRTAILRLGPVGIRAIEGLLGDHGIDPPRAARLARLAGGRPGLALAYADAPEAVGTREEIVRTLLDLLAADRSRRLAVGRELLARAADLARLTPGFEAGPDGRSAGTGGPGRTGVPSEPAGTAAGDDDTAPGVPPPPNERSTRGTPAERRMAARALLETWATVARDLAVVVAGGRALVRDVTLMEELEAAAAILAPGAASAFLGRLARTAELLEANANPELAVDVLVLAWPRAA